MNEQQGQPELSQRVKVSFHRSSARDGQTGYAVEASEGATADEAQRIFAIVAQLKAQADQIVAGKTVEQLSIESHKVLTEDTVGWDDIANAKPLLRRGPANGDPSTRRPQSITGPIHG